MHPLPECLTVHHECYQNGGSSVCSTIFYELIHGNANGTVKHWAANTVNNTVSTGLCGAGRPLQMLTFSAGRAPGTPRVVLYGRVCEMHCLKNRQTSLIPHPCWAMGHHWAFRGPWTALPDHTVFLTPPIAAFLLDASHSYSLCSRCCPMTSKKNNLTS